MTNIFIDTSAFFAALNPKDNHHNKAQSFLKKLENESRYQSVISNLIFMESVTLIRARLSIPLSIKFGEHLYQSTKIKLIYVTPEIEKQAWKIFTQYSDKQFSFVDCTSFAIMKIMNINEAFTFDKHFEQFGFKIIL